MNHCSMEEGLFLGIFFYIPFVTSACILSGLLLYKPYVLERIKQGGCMDAIIYLVIATWVILYMCSFYTLAFYGAFVHRRAIDSCKDGLLCFVDLTISRVKTCIVDCLDNCSISVGWGFCVLHKCL